LPDADYSKCNKMTEVLEANWLGVASPVMVSVRKKEQSPVTVVGAVFFGSSDVNQAARASSFNPVLARRREDSLRMPHTRLSAPGREGRKKRIHEPPEIALR